jgi:flagellar biosynthetic protein FliR
MRIDLSFLPVYAATFMLVFARIGTMLMLLPAFGGMGVPGRVRLSAALLLTAVLLPLHRNAYQLDLTALGPLLTMLGQELLIGGLLGMTGRLAMSALQVAGSVIANQMGLGFVTAVDPTQGQQGVLLGNFLSVLGITLIFATDLHHLVIAALNDSYALFSPGTVPLFGDIAAVTTRTVAAAFKIGVQLAAPFLVFGLLFNLGLGVLSRLMPQMQVFFVGMPLTILLGFLILLMVLGAMMATFIGSIEDVLRELAPSARPG